MQTIETLRLEASNTVFINVLCKYNDADMNTAELLIHA